MIANLNRARIAKKAAQIARRDGVDAITVRAVAARLDVTPMALYRHVGSSEGLRQAGLEVMLLEVVSPPAEGSVRERLAIWARAARPALARYPGLADTLLTQWGALVQGCRIMESLLAVAAERYRNRERRVEIANAVFVYVVTRVAAEQAVRSTLTDGRRRRLPMVEAHPERFPQLVAVSDRFATVDVDRHFAVGLDALLAGLGVR